MAKINELQKYINYEFSSGPYTGKDYKTFETKYINYIRSFSKANGWEVVNVGRNHYCFTLFVKSKENKYVYVSVSDVRHFNKDWHERVLIRTAEHEKDYRGGHNYYAKLEDLQYTINRLLNGKSYERQYIWL